MSDVLSFFETKKGGLLILSIIAVIFFAPILSNPEYWGVRDWGFHLFMNEVEKTSIFQYHQFPFWNPYRCGGNVDFGHPENPILSLHFILVMFMNTMIAIKLNIIIYAIIGLFGMFMISKHFKLERYSSFLPPILYVLNSSLILYLAEGNYWYRAMVWLPWVAYFFLKSEENAKNIFPAAFFMLMIFFDTNSYAFGVTMFFLVVYGIVNLVAKRKWNMLAIAFIILAVTGLIGAIKFLPMLEFNHLYPSIRIDNESGYTFKSLYTGLFNREQGPYSHWFDDKRAFFHHGLYIGVIPFILGVIGILLYYKKYAVLGITALIALITAFGKNSIINIYFIVKSIPLYDYFHEATRFNIIFIFVFALFAGLALSRLEKLNAIRLNSIVIPKKAIKGIVILLMLISVVDMYIVNTAVLPKIFIAKPITSFNVSPSFMQVSSPYGSNPWTDGKVTKDLYYNVWGHAMYLNMKSNLGTRNGNCHGVVNMSAQPVNLLNGTPNPLYRGETYLEAGKGNASITEFTPNKVSVAVYASSDDILVLNQNYYISWRAKGGSGEAFNYNGLVAVPVNAATKQVVFYHYLKSFWIGLVVSIFAIVASLLVYLKFDKLRNKFKLLKFDW